MSMPYRKRVRWMSLSAIPVLFCAVAFIQTKIDAESRRVSEADEELILQSPDAIKKLSLGYDGLLGDIYWTRAVQYYGTHADNQDGDFHLLWPMLDVATTLDPKLEVAYHFGAIFLSEPGKIGAGRTDLAIKLVKKGIAANPGVWQLGTDLGFLYYWRLKDYPDASATYEKTSEIPNSPPWIKMMAARVAQTGGSLETSSILWQQIYDTTSDPDVKKEAANELKGLRSREDMAHLDQIAEDYKAKMGRYPASEQDLREAGFLPGIPVDPDGFAYEFDLDGKAHLNAKTTFVMPLEPKVFAAPSSPNTHSSQAPSPSGTQLQ
jgi:tetratricopeptide (TPR) repeat protein